MDGRSRKATMRQFMKSTTIAALVLVALVLLPFSAQAQAQGISPAQAAEQIRSTLFQAQMDLATNPKVAQQAIATAQKTYTDTLASTLGSQQTGIDRRIQTAFNDLQQALKRQDAPAFAAARADLWTALLAGSYGIVEQSIRKGNGQTAQTWLKLREFRPSTRFSHPIADATLAVEGVIAKTTTPADGVLALRADLFDTYQALLTESLHDLSSANQSDFAVQRAEEAALAEGYFTILIPAYQEQRGVAALAQVRELFTNLRKAALQGQGVPAAIKAVEARLQNFRAAPLSPNERSRRTGQILRFLSLVPVEYGRAISNGTLLKEFELREAITFRDGAEAAFNDLQNLLEQRDKTKTEQARRLFKTLEDKLNTTATHKHVTAPEDIAATTNTLTELLKTLLPPEWQQRNTASDFDIIGSMLDQMESAVAQKQYDMAESARLEAYSILETGPEARLFAFAPESIRPIEDLFWYGQGKHPGLACLINNKAPLSEIKATRNALDGELAAAQKAITSSGSPFSIASNASIIVFREGLEAVLILASLMGSLKRGTTRKFRRPLWLGAAVAFVATVLTWVLAQGILASFARYGELLEAVVSLIAIGVLLLITNWFFHKVYWTGWIANFHNKKRRLLNAEVGQWIGLAVLGFTSIYREGFETVLFLQALVLEAGVATVLAGIGLGLLGTIIVGIIVFALQVKLPYKRMLIVTGIMIGGVLLIMVGNTVHVLQVVGWLPIHVIENIQTPYWVGLWLGLYTTWEGILLQIAAGVFVIGSYFLAERQQHKRNEGGSAPPEEVQSRKATPVSSGIS
jgi:high-affinity iron transporter